MNGSINQSIKLWQNMETETTVFFSLKAFIFFSSKYYPFRITYLSSRKQFDRSLTKSSYKINFHDHRVHNDLHTSYMNLMSYPINIK